MQFVQWSYFFIMIIIGTKNWNVTARKCSDNCNSCNFFRQNVSFDVIRLKRAKQARAKQARAKRARATCSLRICEGYAGSKFCWYSLFLALAGSRYFDSQLNKCKLTRENYKNNSGSVCKCKCVFVCVRVWMRLRKLLFTTERLGD